MLKHFRYVGGQRIFFVGIKFELIALGTFANYVGTYV